MKGFGRSNFGEMTPRRFSDADVSQFGEVKTFSSAGNDERRKSGNKNFEKFKLQVSVKKI